MSWDHMLVVSGECKSRTETSPGYNVMADLQLWRIVTTKQLSGLEEPTTPCQALCHTAPLSYHLIIRLQTANRPQLCYSHPGRRGPGGASLEWPVQPAGAQRTFSTPSPYIMTPD